MNALSVSALLITIMSCVTSKAPEMFDVFTPLIVTPVESKTYRVELDVDFDGKKKRFLFDTGARISGVVTDTDTLTYPIVGKDETVGVSGKAIPSDIIEPLVIRIGSQEIQKQKFQRLQSGIFKNVLGIDVLSHFIFRIDYSTQKLEFLNELPVEATHHPIRKLSRGHIAIPIGLAGQKSFALFDTGAEITVADKQFVENNLSSFEFMRSEDGYDASNQTIESKVYKIRVLQIGALSFNNIEVAVFDFGSHLRKQMEGIPVILGNNVIHQAKWGFDIKSNLWTVE